MCLKRLFFRSAFGFLGAILLIVWFLILQFRLMPPFFVKVMSVLRIGESIGGV